MAKAMSGMFRTHEQQHSWKPPPGPEVSREALTNALLETVRMVLEEQGPELHRLAPSSPVMRNHVCASSDQTASERFLPEPAPGPAPAPAPLKKKVSSSKGILGGPCSHCGTQDSPQWRRPLTKKVVLCNACGIYYSRHHSLPKRKKNAYGTPPVTAEDDGGGDRKDVALSAELSQPTDTCSFDASAKTHPMLCDAPPASLRHIRTKRESLSSGEHSGKAEPASAPTAAAVAHSAVSLGAASPATSCGSPMVSCAGAAGGTGGVTAPPSTPKRRGDESDGPFAPSGSHGGYGEVHAEDSLAKRVMKRAATNAAANAAAAGFYAAPGGAATAATWRTVTTAPPGMQGALPPPSMTVMEAMLQRSRISGACTPPAVFDDARIGSASAAAGELSADSDAGMLDVPRPALPVGGAEAGGVMMRPRRESSPAAVGRSSCPGSPTTSRMKVSARSNAPASGRPSRRLLQQQLQP